MKESYKKQDTFTFFNEEWNAPYWEDGVDEIKGYPNKKQNKGPIED